MGKRITADVIAGAISMLLGLATAFTALGYPSLPSGRPGPGLFPIIVGGALGALGVALLIQGLRAPANRPPVPRAKRTVEGAALTNWLLVALSPVIYMWLAPILGSELVLGGLAVLLMVRLGARIWVAATASALTALGVSVLFRILLRVNLP